MVLLITKTLVLCSALFPSRYNIPSNNVLTGEQFIPPESHSLPFVFQGGEGRDFRRQCQVTVFQRQSGVMGKKY